MAAAPPPLFGGAAIYPLGIEGAAAAGEAEALPEGGLNGLSILAGTWPSVFLRLAQAGAAAGALALAAKATASAGILPPFSLRFLAVVTLLQLFWSAIVISLDTHALLVKRSLQNTRVLLFLVLGDMITACLIFSAASISAGIFIHVTRYVGVCSGRHCYRFPIAYTIYFLDCGLLLPSFLLCYWGLVSLTIAPILHPVH